MINSIRNKNTPLEHIRTCYHIFSEPFSSDFGKYSREVGKRYKNIK